MRDDHCMRIGNEFAAVEVRERRTRVGTRLELRSERTGFTVALDAMGLEALCALSPDAVKGLVTGAHETGRRIAGVTCSFASEEGAEE